MSRDYILRKLPTKVRYHLVDSFFYRIPNTAAKTELHTGRSVKGVLPSFALFRELLEKKTTQPRKQASKE